jgi:zinc protease
MTNLPHSLPGPQTIFRAVTENGITILVRPNHNNPSIFLSGFLPVGSIFDSNEKLGLADFTAASLMRGTAKRNFHQIYDSLESIGATLGFAAGTRTTGFSGRALIEDAALLFDLLTEALRHPTFPPEYVERLRTQLLTGLAIRAQDTGDQAGLAFDKLLFGDHLYQRPDEGYPETIQAIQQNDLPHFYQHHFGPRGLCLAIVGAIEPAQALDLVENALGDWKNPLQPNYPQLPALPRLTTTTRKHVPLPGKSQTDLILGCFGPTRHAEDYLATSLANSVLGQFGMMGRIGDVVRERSGLAYYAYSSLSAGSEVGTWDVSAGVNPANLEKTIDLILQEITTFFKKGVSAEELRDSQDNFVGRLPLSLESNAGVANALLNLERYQLGLDYYQTYESRIRAVTPEQVLAAIQRYLHPDRLAIASAGA